MIRITQFNKIELMCTPTKYQKFPDYLLDVIWNGVLDVVWNDCLDIIQRSY